MSKHTPGPWAVDSTGLVCGARGWGPVASVYPKFRDANARLIAAAPDMLEALEMCVDEYDLGNARTTALDAINKAKGA